MMDESTANFVPRGGFVLRKYFDRGGGRGWCGVAFFAAKKIAAVRKFFDKATFFESSKHLLEYVTFALFDLKGAGDFFDGDGIVPKLQKTEDVI